MGGSRLRAPSDCAGRLNRTDDRIRHAPSVHRDRAKPDDSVIWEAQHAMRFAPMSRLEEEE
jgi:hypothetical protein